ncbi:MAG: type II secretion system protein J [Thermodesulfovibrionales bacterium]
MKGFTLLELLISITMIGLIALIVTGAVRLGSRSVDGGERRIESIERLKNSLEIIESQIMSEIPLSYDEDGNKRYYFQGDKGAVQFATTYSIWGNQKGYVLTSLRVETDSNGKKLLKAKESPLIGGNEAEAVLFEGFDDIYLEYFYKDPTEEEGRWVDEWKEEQDMPEKIKIGLIKERRDFSLILPIPSRDKQSQSSQTTFKGERK